MDTNQLIAQLSSEAPGRKAMGTPWQLASKWLLGFAIYSVLLFTLIDLREDITQQLNSPLFVLELGLLLGIIITSTLSAATLAFPDSYQQPLAAKLPLLFFSLFFMLMLYHVMQTQAPDELFIQECMCTLFITIYAFVPAVWLFFMMRQAASTHPQAAGSVVILTAFSLGALILRLSEANDSMVHFILFHYLPMLAAALIGVVLGRKLLRW